MWHHAIMYRTTSSLLLLGSLLAASSLAGCGGTVDNPPGGGGAGDGGAGAASSSTTASGGGGGAGPMACGGFSGETCGTMDYCDWADDSCGADDGQGQCAPRPDACPEDCPGVCGCDGQFYCNTCIAASAGVDVSANASCTMQGSYAAHFWPGGLDHIIVLKAEPDTNRCVMLYADWPTENAPGFDVTAPPEWGVSHAVITNQAADCAVPPMAPTGEVVDATGASGTLSWVVQPGMYAPCTLDVDVVVAFDGAPAWVPPADQLTATAVAVDGGCM
jgi:hypothetical protein